jgi:spore maturation protein SpmA
MNAVFVVLITAAVLAAAFQDVHDRTPEGGVGMDTLTTALIDAAKGAVDVAFGLIGLMVLFLGMMQVLRDAGAVSAVARALAPVMKRLFPDVPPEHPAMGAMIMNLTANIFGLGNAATPFGLKAMQELNRLNPHPGIATNAMVLFLAINTAGLAVFPTSMIAARATLGSLDPGGIFLPTLLASITGTLVGVVVARLLGPTRAFAPARYAQSAAGGPASTLADGMQPVDEKALLAEARTGGSRLRSAVAWSAAALFLLGVLHAALLRMTGVDLCGGLLHAAPDPAAASASLTAFLLKELMSQWLLPFLLFFAALFGWARGVKVYESAIQGAREGYQIFVMILPFLVLILVSVGMFRASGALGFLIATISPVTELIGFPAEALPMALLRSLSGSGSYGLAMDLMKTHTPDSFVGYLVSVINGSSETTFYVLAVYFGSVGVRNVRHAVIACLAADAAGVLASLVFTRLIVF